MATVAGRLRNRVTLQLRSVERLLVHTYVPTLMTSFRVVWLLPDRGYSIPSPTLLGAYAAATDRDAESNGIPVWGFGRGESKELISRRYFRAAERDGRFGVVLIGVAQEKAIAWRGWRRGGPGWSPAFRVWTSPGFVESG